MTYLSIQPHTDPSQTDIPELDLFIFFILRNIKDLRLIQCWILVGFDVEFLYPGSKKKTSLGRELVNYVRMRGSNDKPLR